eukprot:m.64530 g.64530  ORF g.64530 m.64530 type:complete len:51 (+) comp15888_c0_seq1:224-376(+)
MCGVHVMCSVEQDRTQTQSHFTTNAKLYMEFQGNRTNCSVLNTKLQDRSK